MRSCIFERNSSVTAPSLASESKVQTPGILAAVVIFERLLEASSSPKTALPILNVKVMLRERSSRRNESASSSCVDASESITLSIFPSSEITRSILPLTSLFRFFSSCDQILSHVALTDSLSSFSRRARAFASLSPRDSMNSTPIPPARPMPAAIQPTGPAATSTPARVKIMAATVPPPPTIRLVQLTILFASTRAGVRKLLSIESTDTYLSSLVISRIVS